MAKFLKGMIRLMESILLLVMPLVVFYWLLLTIKLEMLSSFTAILASIFSPFVELTSKFMTYRMIYEGNSVDLTPLLFAFILFSVFLSLCVSEKILDSVEKLILNVKVKAKQNEEKKNKALTQAKFIEELAKNRVIYFIVKFRKKESASIYLCDEAKLVSQDQTNLVIEEITGFAKRFKATRVPQYETEPNTYHFILYEIDDAIDFAFYVHNKVNTVNSNPDYQGHKIIAITACHCAYSENTARTDFPIVLKILGIGGDNEIVVSELFRNKYEAKKEESNISFDSKGYYTVDDFCIEIFHLKVKGKHF